MENSSSVLRRKTELTNGDSLGNHTYGNETNNNSFKIPRSSLLEVLQGVSVAFKLSDNSTKAVTQFFHSHSKPSHLKVEEEITTSAPSFRSWLAAIPDHIVEETPRQVASVAVAVAVLREKCRQATDESTAGILSIDKLGLVWDIIYHALTSPFIENPLGNVSRSAQGFLAVPLCSLIKDGMIDELYRLHVWLPDGQRGNKDCSIHSHQPFAQSWVLAGQGLDCSYEVELNSSPEAATHAEYALAWNDGKSLGKNYNAHQTYSVVANTRKLAHAELKGSAVHTRNMTYSIPSAKFHTSVVAPDSIHATLFFFDSRRGFFKDAGVLGPKDGDSYTQVRTAAGITAASLAGIVQNVREWEILMEQAQHYVQRAEWEHALRYFDKALSLCESAENFPNVASYRNEVLRNLRKTKRRFVATN
ncbi:hypothetical protein F5X99DRAFT_320986 [Biscogniauxia marginata]|nr:hypothetical protein F5X99DRAFT_320986 [Biscogniauxia marginata]